MLLLMQKNSRRAAEVESVAVTVQIGIEPAEKSLR